MGKIDEDAPARDESTRHAPREICPTPVLPKTPPSSLLHRRRDSGSVGDKGSSGESDSQGSLDERRIIMIAVAHRVDCAVSALPSVQSDSRSGACCLLDFSLATAKSDKKEGISETVINSPTIRNRAAPKKPRTDTDRRDRGGREWWPAAAVTAARPHRGCLGAPGPAPGRMDLLRMALGFGVRPLWCEPESTLPLAAARSLASDHNCAGVKTAGMATAGAGRQLGSLHCAPPVLSPASWDVLAGDDCSGCTADGCREQQQHWPPRLLPQNAFRPCPHGSTLAENSV